ncbi:uncharacterized protein CCOS01_01144 [Colletotrichum costaricense]|uniref:Uncharacterized protein n=1 Tax=Colletotrichum costaricense TaxID=1209916 RepID=A0AAI9ZCE2_9PEZI|nr:uncharacterized protein CCOS01_01144 [Colletotrichum costaricense]KAK1539830.1 hypothetical protein CCOS01_01144 [Colletotrichum costaricense]
MGYCHGGRLMTKNGLVRLERPECAVDFFGLFTSVFVNTAEKSETTIVVVFQLLYCLRQILPDYLPRPIFYSETPFVTRFDNLSPFPSSTLPLPTASYENPLSIVLLKPATSTISLAPAREHKGSRPTLASRTLGDPWKERHSGPEQKGIRNASLRGSKSLNGSWPAKPRLPLSSPPVFQLCNPAYPEEATPETETHRTPSCDISTCHGTCCGERGPWSLSALY